MGIKGHLELWGAHSLDTLTIHGCLPPAWMSPPRAPFRPHASRAMRCRWSAHPVDVEARHRFPLNLGHGSR